MPKTRQLYPIPSDDPLDRSTHGFRQLLGWLGILLPPACVAWSTVFPTTVIEAGQMVPLSHLGSVSAYYYTSGVAAFVGVLVSMGLFLFTYKGYDDKGGKWDFWLSTVIGVAAIGIAVFPTDPPHESLTRSWWHPWMGKAHYISAGSLFLLFLGFCWVLFPGKDWRLEAGELERRGWQRLTWVGRIWKYRVYYGCGLVILVCLIWALILKSRGNSIFWPEWGALWFFGIAWLRAGQLQWTLRESALTRPLVAGVEGAGAYLRGAFFRHSRKPPA